MDTNKRRNSKPPLKVKAKGGSRREPRGGSKPKAKGPPTPINDESNFKFRMSDHLEKLEKELGEMSINIEDYEFHHGKLPRDECQFFLLNDGDFLIRQTTDKHDGTMKLVLSVRWHKETKNFIIAPEDGTYRFENGAFETIPELITFYYITKRPITQRTGAILLKAVKREPWELNFEQIIEMDQELGRGNFGVVKKGVYYSTDPSGRKMGKEVALKQCLESMPPEEKRKFLAEARLLRRYQHPNVVRVIGVCTWRDPIMIVMELVSGGSLLHYLQAHRQRREMVKLKILMKFCIDASIGMEYLSSKDCIHRDLSARNCLLGGKDSLSLKISDFGMSREGSSYLLGGSRPLPVKWTAPEAILKGIYTSQADVWSYGILIWEIFSHGLQPYGDMMNEEVIRQIKKGQRLQPTTGTPEPFQTLMQDCWKYEPLDRPNFRNIKNICLIQYETCFGPIEGDTMSSPYPQQGHEIPQEQPPPFNNPFASNRF